MRRIVVLVVVLGLVVGMKQDEQWGQSSIEVRKRERKETKEGEKFKSGIKGHR